MAKDYYKILGVNKTDSTETIKKAYRDAVKRLHPDINRGSFDKKRFYEIQEAYETLGDEEKRKVYDQSRKDTLQRSVRRGGRNAWNIPPFEDLFAWMEEIGPFQRMPRSMGFAPRHRVEITLTAEEAGRGGDIRLKVPIEEPCPYCGGRGEVGLFACPACGGSGHSVEYFPVIVNIPPTVEDGTVIRVPFAGPDGRRHLLVVFIRLDWLR